MRQVQYSLLDRRPENGMTAYCADAGISLLPYGTVAGGLLSDRYLGLPASRCACSQPTQPQSVLRCSK
jgi:aryl-alcohol dehydrogenase-like predicted oxidoreductase